MSHSSDSNQAILIGFPTSPSPSEPWMRKATLRRLIIAFKDIWLETDRNVLLNQPAPVACFGRRRQVSVPQRSDTVICDLLGFGWISDQPCSVSSRFDQSSRTRTQFCAGPESTIAPVYISRRASFSDTNTE